MKKIILIITIIVFTLGCKNFLDVNQSQNTLDLSNATPELIFPAAVEGTVSDLTSVFFLGEIWSQHWTSAPQSPSFQNEDSYQVSAGDYDYDLATWRNMYSGALKDYEVVREKAFETKNWTYYFMATTMQCYLYQILADLWDKIPMSDALKGHPSKFDDGQQVYDSIIARLDFILSLDLNATTCQKPKKIDLVFGGDMNKWKAFANTLKLKIFLRQRYARPAYANEKITSLINSGTIFLDYDAKYAFSGKSGEENYIYTAEWKTGNTNIRASNTLLMFLIASKDDRYQYIYKRTNESVLEYKGVYQGDIRGTYTNPSGGQMYFATPRLTGTIPFYFISKAEVKFILAEVYLSVFNDKNTARTYYLDGISSDISRLKELLGSQVTIPITVDSIAGIGKYGYFNTSASEESLLEQIIIQKWIALANIGGPEAFFEHNRTKYPREYGKVDINYFTADTMGYFIVSCSGILPENNPYPRRLIFPSTELSKNPANAPDIKPIYTPVWWDVKQKTY